MRAIRVNSIFTPHTYDELMAPIRDYREAYKEVEAEYTDLIKMTESWKDIANQENSPEAYRMYRRYADQLQSITEDFSKGMNSRNRRQLLGMKAGYAREIEPIAKAHEAMVKANEYRESKGSDAIFRKSRYNSIDSFLHGKTADNKYESRTDIINRVGSVITNMMNATPEQMNILASTNPYFLQVIKGMREGFTPDKLMYAVGEGTNEKLQELSTLMQSDKEALGENFNPNDPKYHNAFLEVKKQFLDSLDWSSYDYEGRKALEEAIDTGLYQGLQKISTGEPLRDPDKPSKYEQMSIAVQRESNAIQRAGVNETIRHNAWTRDMTTKEKLENNGQIPYNTYVGEDGNTYEEYRDIYKQTFTTKRVDHETFDPNKWYILQDGHALDTITDKNGKKVPVTQTTPGARKGDTLYRIRDGKPIEKRTVVSSSYTPDASKKLGITKSAQNSFAKMNSTEKNGYLQGKVGYFEAHGASGNEGFKGRALSFNGYEGEGGQYSTSNLTGNGYSSMLNIVGEFYGIDNLAAYMKDLHDNDFNSYQKVKNVILNNTDGFRDQNMFSRNYFAVYLKGMDKEGRVTNTDEASQSYMAIQKALSEAFGDAEDVLGIAND